jgi:Flp pilus assembly protein TadG
MKKFGRKRNYLKMSNLRPIKNTDGAVTAETAIGITSLSTFLVLSIFMISYVSSHLMISDAARTAARLVARGEGESAVKNAVSILAPGSEVFITYGYETARVQVVGPANPKIIWYLPRVNTAIEAYLESSW